MDSPSDKDDHFEPENSFPEEHVPWHERPVDDDDTVDDMETPHGSDSEKLTQEALADVGMQAAPISEPQALFQLPFLSRAQPEKVDTSQYKKRLLDLILKAALSGHPAPVKRAIQTLNEYCDVQQHPVSGVQLLDFVPQKNSPINVPADLSLHSPLMIACEKENSDLVEILLDNGASAAFRNKDKLNALHIACNKGNMEIVELLLEAAGSQKRFSKNKKHFSDLQWTLNARNERGWSPLMFAIKGGQTDVVKRLIQTGAVNYQTKNRKQCNILHIASRESNLDCLKVVLTLFDNDSDSELILATDKNEWNILHHACANKHVGMLEWLLSQLSEDNRSKLINQQNKAGYTPLLAACEYQNVTAAQLLLDHGADASLCAKDGDDQEGKKSGLHVAAIHDSKDIAKLLLDKECPIDTKDSEGNSPLHVAYKKSSFEVIAILRQKDDGRLESLKNKAERLASDIIPDDIIPPEIKKRGKIAIDLYKKALKEGKKKIPRCNLLILGEQRVGKTSVYRLLVGLGFNENQDPTMGIENTVVDTLDKRFVNIDLWEEKSEDVQKDQSRELFAEGVVGEVRGKLPPKKEVPKKFEPVSEEQLMREAESLKVEIERKIKETTTPEVDVVTANLQRMEINQTAKVQSDSQLPPLAKRTASATAPPPREYPPKPAPIKEHSETRTHEPEKVQVTRPEPPRVDRPSKPPLSEAPQHASPFSDIPTPTIPTAEPPLEIVPIVNRKHRHSINERLKSTTTQVEKEPSLILNTLDFAGQPEYRPMHHCFITRRAIYMVVFNLQHMVQYLEHKESQSAGAVVPNPLEEVRYWLHSIHAHIYPPDKDVRGRDETMSRICLVGTHRAPTHSKEGEREITDDDLDKIDRLLRKELRSDDRCVNHIHCMKGSKRIFAAVENSIDRKDAKARKDSGAKMLQNELKFVSNNLSFLKEDYPIVWLQFESELMRQREYQKQRSLSMVIKLEELRRIANRQGIATVEAQNVAFNFFHDTGKIVYLEQTPKLFLNDEEHIQLANLVILDPAWLIKVIKVIFEMKDSFPGVPKSLVRDLNARGIASCTLLKACWEEFTHTGTISFQQLCLMLQANCLIYPVKSQPCPNRAESDPLPSSSQLPTPPAKSQTSPEVNNAEVFFLVPCKLPEKMCETHNTEYQLPWITFYFDFQKFLPMEIYHRLVCLMLAASDTEGSRKKRNAYSSTCCLFYNIDSCKWKIELQENLHHLKVSVMTKEGDKRTGTYFITKVHTEYLQRICQSSNLQGLEYYGGPLVKCTNCGDEGIIEFVGYENGKTKRSSSHCSECSKLYCVDDLLKPQTRVTAVTEGYVEPEASTEIKTAEFTPVHASQTVQRNLLPQRKCSTDGSTSPRPTLSFQKLTIIKWKDENEEQKPLRIICNVARKWHEAGRTLGIEFYDLESIGKKHRDPDDCCCDVFKKWMDGGCSTEYPVSWEGLTELLVDLQLEVLANNLKIALNID